MFCHLGIARWSLMPVPDELLVSYKGLDAEVGEPVPNAAPTSAAPGNVRTQAYTIRRAQIHRTVCQPRVAPTPEIAPAIACVVEMGTEARVASPIVVAAANSAENPPIGCRWGVIRDPMVFTIRHPPSIVPIAIAAWQLKMILIASSCFTHRR
jgi:hypothetical protein